jgi:hypothetical protein
MKQFAWYNVTLHPSSKFYQVASALLGTSPPSALEMDDLVGRKCLVDIEHYENNKGQKRAKVVDVRLAR